MTITSLRRARRVGVIFGCAALTAMAFDVKAQEGAQTPPPDRPTFRTGVNLVRVDVTVTGRRDQPIDDLEAADFEIQEDGIPQKIEAFQFLRLTGQQGPGDETSLEIRSQSHGAAQASREDVRVFALYLDEYHISDDIATTQRLRSSLTKWVETLQPTDIVMLMDPLTPMSGIEYTRSKFDLIEKIKKFKGRRGVYMPVRSALEEGQLQSRNPRRVRAEVSLSALAGIVTHLGSLRERRSSVIFVSEGPPLLFNDANIEDRIRDVLEAANRFNVIVNVLDPRGLTTVPASGTLWRLSGETGGRAIVNTNGFEDGLAQVSRDASAYYLVGYAPARVEADGKFHEIEVKVRRKGAQVLARKGYWAPSEEELTAAVVVPVPAAVTKALDAFTELEGARRALTWMGFEPGDGGHTRVNFSWQPMRRETDPELAPVALKVVSREASLVRLAEQVLRLDAASAAGRLRPAAASIDVPPGNLSLTFRLETDQGEVIDRWNTQVDVPSFETAKTTMGTPRLLVAHSALEFRSLTASPGDAVPTPLREFRRTDRVLVWTAVLQEAEAKDLPAVALLNKAGAELVRLTPTRPPSDGALRFELPLANLAAGDYVLRLDVAPDVEGDTQHVAFRVVP